MKTANEITGATFWTVQCLSQAFDTRAEAWAAAKQDGYDLAVEGPWFQTSDGVMHDSEAAMNLHIADAARAPFDFDGYNMAGVEHRLPGQVLADADGAAKFREYCREMGANS